MRVRVLISGRVQGVGFRYYTRQKAEEIGLTGWVQNLPDGRVEAEFQGDEAMVSAILRWCERGPTLANVRDVETIACEEAPDALRFVLRS